MNKKELMPTGTSMISTTNSDQVEGAELPAAGGFAAQRITIAGGEDDDSQNEPGGMTFTLFKKLPAELRVKIWRFSLPVTRYIEVRNIGDVSFEAEYSKVLGAKPPSNFSACRESRYEALPLYKPFQIFPGPASPTVFLNPNMDILCLTHFRGEANGKVWRTFERQGLSFRRMAMWDLGFLRDCLRRFRVKKHKLRNLEEMLLTRWRWEDRKIITSFEEERSFFNGDQHWVDAEFDLFWRNEPSLQGTYPLVRGGTFF